MGNRPEALGQSEAFVNFQERLSLVAKVNRPVLIIGERGTGKELAASRLHYLSQRWQGPLVALNCAALAESLMESELFGHEPGAFTGATGRRRGRFEAALGGTLFLDEIGLIPMAVQEKILRVVEYGELERVGGNEPIEIDVRIIGATNADLPELARQGKFKEDLLDRLSFEVLRLPALRERLEDIPLLARQFAARMSAELGFPGVPEISESALAALISYPWPGNIRQLKNVIERAVYLSGSPVIDHIEFDPFEKTTPPSFLRAATAHPAPNNKSPASVTAQLEFNKGSLTDSIRDFEQQALKSALEATQYHQANAARLLGLTYHQFRNLHRKHKSVSLKHSP